MPASLARPRSVPRWVTADPPDVALIARLSDELRLPPLACSLLVSRGHREPDAAKAFLRPRLDQLHPPGLLTQIERAVSRITEAIRAGQTILIHGDYDVDGMCSTTLLTQTIRYIGGTAVPFIPHRVRDGYDLSDAGVRAATECGASVVITCDCGTSAHAAVDELTRRNVDVIITDHHLPSMAPPACLAVLNPRVPGCEYPDRDLCATGVAFKLSLALLEASGASTNVALGMLDLVALATVADVVPLRGENRVLVRYGMRLMEETRNIGLRALIGAVGLEGRALTAGRIGYLLAPRLNAVGRLSDALRGVQLLLTRDVSEANALARDFEELNRARQALDRETLDVARSLAEGLDLDATFGVVLAAEGWHAGVIGIVASRLVEELCRPVVLITVDGIIGKGSGRSIPGFDLHEGLVECSALLRRYGGHRAAAGLTIDAARIPEFAARFNQVASEHLSPSDLVPEVRVDAEVPLCDANDDLERLLRHFEPFGLANPAPLFVARRVRIDAPPKMIAQQGLKLRFSSGNARLEGVWWGAADRGSEFPANSMVDVAFRLERDTYLDVSRAVARVVDMRLASGI
jgi:single-stranded-DNA-specific exonuclease